MKEIKNKNFQIKDSKFIGELNSQAYFLEHLGTGAQVLYLDNQDEIKTFGIAFRTPPRDSTGVAHIVEHCVLSGSRKYRTKEPFMDMINSSMQVFLNAMTYPDKTVYPIASRNTKDFYNLMDLYLDAVFYPRIYEDERIFLQEGWHYELEDQDKDLIYNGVVYNEMRGAYSDSDGQVHEILAHKLHPGSTYAHDSGGNPFKIVDLDYQDFLDFHRTYYHPSNSYIFLAGDMEIGEVLDRIDGDYLSSFQRIDPKSDIILKDDFQEARRLEAYYSVGQEDPVDKRAYLVYGVSLGDSRSMEDRILRNILSEVLLNSDSSSLKELLLKSQLAEDYYIYSSASLPLDIYFIAKNARAGNLDTYIDLINKELERLVREGLDRDTVQAAMTMAELSLKDLGTNRGVYLGLMALSGWLYGASPLESLGFGEVLDKIKGQLDSGYLERMIEERILDNPQKIYMEVLPKRGYFQDLDQEARDKLAAHKASLDQEEIEDLVKKTQDLFDYQLSEDSKEAKATIPKLDLSDISKDIVRLNTSLEEKDYTQIYIDEFTNGLTYQVLAFNLGHLLEEDLAYLGVLVDCLGQVDTENYSYRDLYNRIYIETGGIGFGAKANYNLETGKTGLYLDVSSMALEEKTGAMEDLVEEILLRSSFEDQDRIKEILTMSKSSIEASLEPSGHRLVMNEIQASLRDSSYLNKLINGTDYYFFLQDLVENYEERKDDLTRRLQDLYQRLLTKELILSLAGKKSSYHQAQDLAERIRSQAGDFQERLVINRRPFGSLALKSSSNIVYVGEGYEYGQDYRGDLLVLSKILNGSYLHNNIRAKGGAYGGGVLISNNQTVSFFSYRDPNLDQTYQVYQGTKDFVKDLDLDQEELTSYIISTMNQLDPPLSPSMYAGLELNRHRNGVSFERLEELKGQALETNLDRLRSYWTIFDKKEEDKVYVVMGSRTMIDQAEKKFQEEKELSGGPKEAFEEKK